MHTKIELYLAKSLFGFDIIELTGPKQENKRVIGRLMNLDPLVEYIHLSQDYVPTCVRKDGSRFKVPLCESVHVYTKDRLYFSVGGTKEYYVEIKEGSGPNKYAPIRSEN